MSEEEEIISRKLLIFILLNAMATFIIGLILLLLGYNIYFNEMFYNNKEVYLVFSIITYLGDTIIYIVIVVCLWYAYDKRFAKNLAYNVLLGGGYVNNILKDIFQDPRPWTRREVTDYGFPSGHSQSAATVYGYIAYKVRKKNKIIAWICIGIAYLVAISRIIIGVHDIHDIWGGLLFGMFFVTLFIILEPKASEIINSMSIALKALLVIIIPLVLFIIAMVAFPNSDQSYGQLCGFMIGLGLGYIIECEKIGYDPTVLNQKQRIINLIIGLILTFAFYFLLSFIPLESQIWDLIQSIILALLLSTLIPWIFTKIQK
ncbi:MAG: phosphatase PAP2 family protein [Promethearchaeota archaeon]|nr:MAG: phosphatase PAP2 family protein [Candidatus Lokiarchaeota archaeon]